jgi:hypothetical protein
MIGDASPWRPTMETIEVIVIYLVAYASLIVVIGIAVYMVALAIVERRRERREPQPTSAQPQPTSAQPQPTSAQPQPTSAQPQPTRHEGQEPERTWRHRQSVRTRSTSP